MHPGLKHSPSKALLGNGGGPLISGTYSSPKLTGISSFFSIGTSIFSYSSPLLCLCVDMVHVYQEEDNW